MPIHTGPEAHQASCTMGTGSFLGIRWTRCGDNHTTFSSIKVANGMELYLCACTGMLWAELYLCTVPVSLQSAYNTSFNDVNAMQIMLQLCTNCWYVSINTTFKVQYTYDTKLSKALIWWDKSTGFKKCLLVKVFYNIYAYKVII